MIINLLTGCLMKNVLFCKTATFALTRTKGSLFK